jgi:hypothetical protein
MVALGLERAMNEQDAESAQLVSKCNAMKTKIAHVQHEAMAIRLANTNMIKMMSAEVAKLNITAVRLKYQVTMLLVCTRAGRS